jgi:hypothetical protein
MGNYTIILIIVTVLISCFVVATLGLKKNFQIIKNELKNNKGKNPIMLLIAVWRLDLMGDYFKMALSILVFIVIILFLIYKGIL